MEIINNSNILSEKTYIALGSFDGLHWGHIKLINKCIEISKQNQGKSMVYTFINHPLTVVNPTSAPKLIMGNEDKIELLKEIGIDMTCLVKFDEKLMRLTPEQFILELINKYSMAGVVVGFNYRFGHRNSGDVQLLKELSEKYNFSLSVMKPENKDDELVSSSRIRKLIEDGDMVKANEMLYQTFKLNGRVVQGKKLGRKLGYPTANMEVNDKYVIPKNGVYYTVVKYKGKLFKAMTNVGLNPTVEETNNVKIETYILDFEQDIYDEYIDLYFLERIRDEIKFSNIDELTKQMKNDYSYVNNRNIVEFYKK